MRRILKAWHCKRRPFPWYLTTNIGAGDIIGVWQAKGAASLAASYIPLIGSSGALTTSTAPTWNATDGWIFNGTNQYLLIPSVPITENLTVVIRFTNCATPVEFAYLLGNTVTDKAFSIMLYNNVAYEIALTRFQISKNEAQSAYNIVYITAASVLAFNRNDFWLDGVTKGQTLTPYSVSNVDSIALGASWNGEAVAYHTGVRIQAVALYNKVLTAAQVVDISAKMKGL